MKILIADDHWIVRETLRQVLKQLGRTDEIVEASSFGEMLQVIDNSPDIGLILVDLVMPDFEAFDGLKALRRRVPQVPLVVVSVHENREQVMQAISLGVIGYIPKTASPNELMEALRLVMDGHVSYPRHILQQTSVKPNGQLAPSTPAGRLTDRESDVLLLLGEGSSVSRIAERLQVSPHTVRVHISNMMRRLGFGDRAALLHYAINRRKDA